MYPNQSSRVLDKENDIVETGVARGHPATLVKQASLLGNRTPVKQQQQHPGKMNLTKTPTQQGKNTLLAHNSPTVLRAKTNQQQLPPTNEDSNAAAMKKKTGLVRTFSATLENTHPSSSFAPSTPVASESRRRSLTKRGSAKARLLVHKDEPVSDGSVADLPDNTNVLKPAARLVRATPVETATTLLSVERALESDDRVVVGSTDNKTKRRALMNDEDNLEIEYCPPPVPEQPYEPEDRIDTSVLSTIPPAIAYRVRSFTEFDLGLPDFEPAEITRLQSPSSPHAKPENVTTKRTSLLKTAITTDGHFEAIWSDDEENDVQIHPKGGRIFGIKDLDDETKISPPFEGFFFDLNAQSEDSLSEDEDDIFGGTKEAALLQKINKDRNEFNETLGLEDLSDESKVEAPFSDFAFEL
ncbi:hypothetical protein BGX28_009244 [Mortierella sp. GBA30]|nr:hypothetical protein BGX28_009244 [Mortierella sp. GBA30]